MHTAVVSRQGGGEALALVLHPRTALVPVETARAVLGCEAEGVWARIESGELLYAFNISAVSAGNKAREVRLWVGELMGRPRRPGLEQALEEILGTFRAQYRAHEVWQMLLCSRPHLRRLLHAGELGGPRKGAVQYITRASLADFLRRRWLGNFS